MVLLMTARSITPLPDSGRPQIRDQSSLIEPESVAIVGLNSLTVIRCAGCEEPGKDVWRQVI